jgi:hypothetical protein
MLLSTVEMPTFSNFQVCSRYYVVNISNTLKILCRKCTVPASRVLLQCTSVYTIEVCTYTNLCITIIMMIIMYTNDTNIDRYWRTPLVNWRRPLATSCMYTHTHTHTHSLSLTHTHTLSLTHTLFAGTGFRRAWRLPGPTSASD